MFTLILYHECRPFTTKNYGNRFPLFFSRYVALLRFCRAVALVLSVLSVVVVFVVLNLFHKFSFLKGR